MFNRDKLKIKHILGIEKDLPGYPTGDDIVKWITVDENKPQDSTGCVVFNDLQVKGYMIKNKEDHIDQELQKLISEGIIEYIGETSRKKKYRILKNDYL